MSFFYDAFKDFTIKNRSVVSDGEGGYITTWTDGAVVKMSLTLGSAQEAREALSQRLNATFTAALPIDTPVKRDDYLQSVDTGDIYRRTTERRPKRCTSACTAQQKGRSFLYDKTSGDTGVF